VTAASSNPCAAGGPASAAEVEAGAKKAERGRDDVGDERSDISRRSADDDADGKLRDVSRLDEGANGMTRPPVQPSSFGRRPGAGFLFLGLVWS